MSDKTIQAQVEAISPLTDSIVQLILTPDEFVDYQAGQYLQILFDDEAFSYSIANAPLGSHKYELHIRHSLDNPYNQRLFAHIKKQGTVTLRLPFGGCSINHLAKRRPIMFIAGGTGFAPVKAMVEGLLASASQRDIYIYWGMPHSTSLYTDIAKSWAMEFNHVHYVPVISSEDATWHGRVGFVHQAVLDDFSDLSEYHVYACGSPLMIDAAKNAFIANGLDDAHFYSDAFVPSK